MMPRLLAALDFRSNNGAHRPLLDALDAIRRARGRRAAVFPGRGGRHRGRDPPEVARRRGRGRARRRAAGEPDQLRDLRAADLRERLRCKEIWVAGADRFRNPDEDLPADFAARRDGLLRAPRPARGGAGASQQRCGRRWRRRSPQLDRGMPRNPRRPPRPAAAAPDRGHARSSPSPSRRAWRAQGRARPALADDRPARHAQGGRPARRLHRRLHDRGDPRDDSTATRLRRRLLLCLYGLGTNAGLKRLAVGRHGFSYKELLHTRRRFIDADALRDAIAGGWSTPRLRARHPAIWGEGTTACASDSQEVRRLGPEPDDRVARPLRRARRDDLLARRARLGVHLLAAASAARRPRSPP